MERAGSDLTILKVTGDAAKIVSGQGESNQRGRALNNVPGRADIVRLRSTFVTEPSRTSSISVGCLAFGRPRAPAA
jgi:hypothetical protein